MSGFATSALEERPEVMVKVEKSMPPIWLRSTYMSLSQARAGENWSVVSNVPCVVVWVWRL